MGEFWPILQVMVMVFFAIQLERINFSLKDINHTLTHVLERWKEESKE